MGKGPGTRTRQSPNDGRIPNMHLSMKVGGGGGSRHVPARDLAGVCQHSLINDSTAAADRLPPKPELEIHRARDSPHQAYQGRWAVEQRERAPSELESTRRWGKEERDAAKTSM